MADQNDVLARPSLDYDHWLRSIIATTFSMCEGMMLRSIDRYGGDWPDSRKEPPS